MSSLNSIDLPFTQTKVDIAASTDVIAAPGAGLRLRIYGLNISSASTGTVTFKHATTGFEGARTMAVGVPLDLEVLPSLHPWFICGVNEAFNITLSGSAQTSGSIWSTTGP